MSYRLGACMAALHCWGCFAPMVQAEAGAVVVEQRGEHRPVGAGYRSTFGGGFVPKEQDGPLGGIEGVATYDELRNTAWTLRAFAGYGFMLEDRMSLELAGDIGTRINGGIFTQTAEPGVRLTLVWPLSPARTPEDRNDAFVFASRNVDLITSMRGGWQVVRDQPNYLDGSATVGLRIWAWTDIL